MALNYKRKEGQIKFTAGTQGRLELSRNNHVRSYICRLDITHTNVAAAFKSGGFANLINDLQIVANGNKTIKQVNIKKFLLNAIFANGKTMHSDIKTADGVGHKSTLFFRIEFSKQGTARPEDTIEFTRLYSTFDMLVNWANASDVGAGITVTDALLTVSSNQFIGYSRNAGEQIAHHVETQLTSEITSTTSEFQINLPVKKRMRSLCVVSEIDGVRSDLVINKVKLKSGTTVFFEIDAQDLKADYADRLGVEDYSDLVGVYLLQFTERGRNSDVLDTNGTFNTLELVLDVTKQNGTNRVTVYTDTIDVEAIVEVPAK